MMSAPHARTSSGRIALTVAAVPTGMNAGVRISPRSIAIVPVRAAPLQALGTNKLQSVFGTGVALRNYWRSGLIEWRPNRLTVALVFVGAVAGALVVQLVQTQLLALIIPVLLVASALYIL